MAIGQQRGGQVGVLPAEFFGGSGLAASLRRLKESLDERDEKERAEEDRDRDIALQNLQTAKAIGADDETLRAMAEKAGLLDPGIAFNTKITAETVLSDARKAVAAGTANPNQILMINRSELGTLTPEIDVAAAHLNLGALETSAKLAQGSLSLQSLEIAAREVDSKFQGDLDEFGKTLAEGNPDLEEFGGRAIISILRSKGELDLNNVRIKQIEAQTRKLDAEIDSLLAAAPLPPEQIAVLQAQAKAIISRAPSLLPGPVVAYLTDPGAFAGTPIESAIKTVQDAMQEEQNAIATKVVRDAESAGLAEDAFALLAAAQNVPSLIPVALEAVAELIERTNPGLVELTTSDPFLGFFGGGELEFNINPDLLTGTPLIDLVTSQLIGRASKPPATAIEVREIIEETLASGKDESTYLAELEELEDSDFGPKGRFDTEDKVIKDAIVKELRKRQEETGGEAAIDAELGEEPVELSEIDSVKSQITELVARGNDLDSNSQEFREVVGELKDLRKQHGILKSEERTEKLKARLDSKDKDRERRREVFSKRGPRKSGIGGPAPAPAVEKPTLLDTDKERRVGGLDKLQDQARQSIAAKRVKGLSEAAIRADFIGTAKGGSAPNKQRQIAESALIILENGG